MSLSPFDIKGRGRTNTNTRFFSWCRRKRSADLMYTEVTMFPLSSCWTHKHIFQWSTWLYDLPITNDSYLHQRSIQVDLHMRLKYPTKWVYKFDSTTKPSGFKNLNKSLHDWKLQFYIIGLNHDLFISLQVWIFMTITRKTSRERSYFRTIIMPTMHYSQQG